LGHLLGQVAARAVKARARRRRRTGGAALGQHQRLGDRTHVCVDGRRFSTVRAKTQLEAK